MKSNILIIDNEVKLSALLARILEMENYHVLQVGNAKAGLKIVEREDIRVVLSDVNLPDANGVELIKKIKRSRQDIGNRPCHAVPEN
jgi:DNA-binding response OmpR family regulator